MSWYTLTYYAVEVACGHLIALLVVAGFVALVVGINLVDAWGCRMHNRKLRHGAVRWSRSAEEHPSPVVEMPDSIRAADARQLAATCIMRSAGQLLVNRFQRCGVNMHYRFIIFIAKNWLGEFFVARRCSTRV